MSDVPKSALLSVVVPVYFNEGSLPILTERLRRLEERLEAKGVGLELVFVDDGSGDDSFSVLMQLRRDRPATKVIKLTRNFGATAAAKTGMQYATGDCVVILAADLQDPVELVETMVERWLDGKRFVICTRASRDDPALTRLLSGLYYRIVSLLIIADYPARGFDMMLLDRALVERVANCAQNTNIHLYAYWLGFEPSTITYDRPARLHGKSRWSLAKRVKLFADTMTGFSVFPIRLISGFGLIVALASFAYGAMIIINALLGPFEVQGFATIVALISFFFGLTLVMLGLIGEYLWRIFDNTNKKPESVVDETFL